MLKRLLPLFVFLIGTSGSIAAQQPRRATEVAAEEPATEPWVDMAVALRLQAPPQLALFERRPFTDWVREWTEATRLRLAARERSLLHERGTLRRVPVRGVGDRGGLAIADSAGVAGDSAAARDSAAAVSAAGDTVNYLPLLTTHRDTLGARLPGVAGQYADIGVVVRGRGELGGQWNRYDPCDQSIHLDCNPGLTPDLKPDLLFAVGVGGTISERFHVNVDFDQAREFDAANNINVFYQGLADEVLQRVEVGDVSIRLPVSRFITRGVPAGNFGFMATGQLGPMDFQTVFAQQKGDVTSKEFTLGGGSRQGLEQDAELVLDDAEYAEGQFFFLVEPQRLTGAPHVDVLALRPDDAEPSFRPADGGTIQLYRDERLSPASVQQSAQLGYFLASATPPGGGTRHSGTFRRLIPEQDYTVHSSGLWIMLRSPLRPDEALATSYVTQSGDTIGTFDAERAPAGVTPELLLLRGATTTHQPGSPTWPMELHQVYRLDGSSEVDPSRIELLVTLGEAAGGARFREVNGQQVSFLRLFGLDEDAPVDQLDQAQIFQPGRGMGEGGQQVIGGTFIVFPTLQPFLDPPPVPSASLTADQAKAALGADANAAIYEEVDPVRRETTTRFRLSFKYRVSVQGVVSSFSLGAFGIREGSERLRLGSVELRRGVDYTINYDIGQVQLLDPQSLFGTNPDAQLRAAWEQKPMFQVAPTSLFGMNTRFQLGNRGELNFVGLYQVEKSLMNRPQLGTEPGSNFLGGTSARIDLGGALVERALGLLPGLNYNGPAAVRLTGELAFSTPDPNTRGAAYLDDFEAGDELRIEPRRNLWKLGSRPVSAEGASDVLPAIVDEYSAVPLTWQHDYLAEGRTVGAVYPSAIDREIRTAGTQLPENVLYLDFGHPFGTTPPLPPRESRRWRSITQVISTTGADLSRSEYLEFYAQTGPEALPLALVLDLGVVAEDAFYVDAEGRTTGTYPEGGEPWGLGLPDEEASLARREVWSRELDARGLWNQPCVGSANEVFPFGSEAANCTRSNGLRDTEDLNGDGIVSFEDGQYFRYVVPLDAESEYLVRDRGAAGTGTNYRLYRIPLRGDGATAVGASEATWRFVRHLRITVAGEVGAAPRPLALARMRIVGSRWAKRDVTGVVRGLLDAEPGAGGAGTQVRVGPVSQLTDGLVYQRPPFVEERSQDRQSNIGGAGIELNEKSLRIAYEGLEPGDRAEAYFHYAQQPRNFLTYRQLRLWAVAREGQWGRPDGERLLLKVGTDPKNYYLYQTRLKPATGERRVTAEDWLPEVVVDFQPWLELRAAAERQLVERGDQSSALDTLWSADSTYAVVYESRARAPNLAAIRELSLAVYNGGVAASTGEVWIDDLRLGSAERQAGTAAAVGLELGAGDFLTGSLHYARQGDVFRQLNEDPTYLGTADLVFSADARLDRFLPASWGLHVPLSVSHMRNTQDPTFLAQSDVAADELQGLRETGAGATRVGMRLRKLTPTANPLLGVLIDGTSLSVGWSQAHTSAITSRSESGGLDATLAYQRDIGARSFHAVPGFVAAALRALAPARVEESAAFGRLLQSRLRWTPTTISFSSGYADQLSRSFLYSRILDLPGDTAIAPRESPRRALRNQATLSLRPFTELDLSVGVASDRDLLEPERAVPRAVERAALERARGGLAGLDLGWERSRSLTTRFGYRPVIADWLRLTYTRDTRFSTGRDASYLEYIVTGADTTAELQRRFESERRTSTRVQFRPADLLNGWLGRPDTTARGFGALLRRQLGRLQPVDLNWTGTLGSAFERELGMPGSGYQLGRGGVDGFRFLDGDTAVRVRTRDEFRATAGVSLLADALFTLSYRDNSSLTLDARGGRSHATERAWPGGTLTLRSLPFLGFLASSSLSMGVERVERSTVIGTTNPQTRGSTSVDLVPRLSLGIGRGRAPILVTYDGRFDLGDSFEPTGRAEDFTGVHTVMLTSVVQLPAALRGSLNEPLNVTLTYSQNNQRRCRVLTSAVDEACAAYIDLATRNGSLRLDTMLGDLRFGTSIDYTSRNSYVGLRNGSNQFQLMLFGEFNFSAGQMPAGFGGIR